MGNYRLDETVEQKPIGNTRGGWRVSQEGDWWAQTCREVERWARSVSLPGQAALRAATPQVSHLGKENKDLDCEDPKSLFQIKASFEFHFGNPAPGGQRRGEQWGEGRSRAAGSKLREVRREGSAVMEDVVVRQWVWSSTQSVQPSTGELGTLPASLCRHAWWRW